MSTILVVEDETSVRTLAGLVLESAGHIVALASNGLEGISLFRSSPDTFDLILTDLTMPIMDGNQLIKLIRQNNPNAKIICMSGFTDRAPPVDVEFLPKPFLPRDLLTLVGEVLRRR